MMMDISVRLSEAGVKLLEHKYAYASFGSWIVKVMFKGKRYRIIYDGRDGCVSLAKNEGMLLKEDWHELPVSTKAHSTESMIEAVAYILGRLPEIS